MSDGDTGQVVVAAAETYERFFVPALFGQWPPRVIELAGVAPGQRVLDVGCGTGVFARAAPDVVGPAGRVVGVDPNAGMLEVAGRSREVVEWVPGSAEDLPFPDGSFDHVASLFAAMFFGDRATAIEEMARVTVRGGSVTVVTWAELETAPGYAAMASLLDDLFGPSAARAVTAPFGFGRASELQALLEQATSDVSVRSVSGEARFGSIDSWIHTEIRGWTLADEIDDEQFAELVIAGRGRLKAFTDGAGKVTFPVSALVGIGTRPSV